MTIKCEIKPLNIIPILKNFAPAECTKPPAPLLSIPNVTPFINNLDLARSVSYQTTQFIRCQPEPLVQFQVPMFSNEVKLKLILISNLTLELLI